MELPDSFKKIRNKFGDFSRSSFYTNAIRVARVELDLPEDGLVLKNEEELLKFADMRTFPLDKEKRYEDFIAFHTYKIAGLILEEFSISNEYLKQLVKYHIIFNNFFYENLAEWYSWDSTCLLSHADYEHSIISLPDRDDEASFDFESYNRLVDQYLYEYPISIRIHPDTSQKDINGFVKDHWSEIEKLQEKYKKPNKYSFKYAKKIRNPDVEARNDFIWRHRDLEYKDIVEKLVRKSKSNGDIYDLDEGAVGKILSLQRELRE